jgi:hypothetical protein
MDRLYLLPVEEIIDDSGRGKGPKYLNWHWSHTDRLPYHYAMMDYGFAPFMLVLIKGISQEDHDDLILNSDVYSYPPIAELDQSIDPQDDLDTFFESIGIPTDWLNPANTYLEFLRQMSAMFQFNQRYEGIVYALVGEHHDVIQDVGGLDVRYNSWDPQVQTWFGLTLTDLGYPQVSGNPQLRHLMKTAGDYWGNTPFKLGGYTF